MSKYAGQTLEILPGLSPEPTPDLAPVLSQRVHYVFFALGGLCDSEHASNILPRHTRCRGGPNRLSERLLDGHGGATTFAYGL
jgi:hypothetical protein